MRTLPLVALLLLASCGGPSGSSPEPGDSMPPTPAELISEYAERWMALDGVHGVYEGVTDDGRPCLRVMVDRITDELRAAIPPEVSGVPVEFHETGPLVPRDSD